MNNMNQDREFNKELMNQVIDIVEDTFTSYMSTGRDSTIYYPKGINKYKLHIELVHSSTDKIQNSRLVLSYRNSPDKPWITAKFNYSTSSLKKLNQLLEHINIILHRE